MRVAIAQYDGATTIRVLPLAAGLLAATLGRAPDLAGAVVTAIHRRRVAPADAARALAGSDVLGLSLYTWNERYTLEVARRVKAASPETLVVAGGPSVPRRAADVARYLDAHPALDALVAGEGERVFTDIVRARRDGRSIAGIAGVSTRDADGGWRQVARGPRLVGTDFASPGAPSDGAPVASPYLDGTFDALLAEPGATPVGAAVFETNRGCPFSCTFCDWGAAIESKVHELPLERVLAELRWAAERALPYVYFIDANFGIRRRDVAIIQALGHIAAATGYPKFVYFHLTKNANEKNLATVEALLAAGIGTQVSLSIQDFDLDVLAAIKRDNIHPERVLELRARCHAQGLPTNNELLLGLPAQTGAGFRRSLVQALTPFAGDSFYLYMTRILVNAELADPAYRARWGLVTREVPSLPRDHSDEMHVVEREEVVVGSAAMSLDAWRDAYAFGYLFDALVNQRLLATTLRLMRFTLGIDIVAVVDALLAAPSPRLSAVRGALARFSAAVLAGEATTLPIAELGATRREPAEAVCAVALADWDAFRDEVRAIVIAHATPSQRVLVEEALAWDAFQIPQHRAPAETLEAFQHDWTAWVPDAGQPPPARPTRVRRHVPPWVEADAKTWFDTFIASGYSKTARVDIERLDVRIWDPGSAN